MCNNILCHNNVPAYIRDDGTAEYDPEFVHGHFRIKVVYQAGHKEKGDTMTLTDVMTVFRQIIGHIARINKTGAVKIEDVAHDMGVDIADVRLWLRLMESMGIVQVDMQDDLVVLRLPMLDYIGFDTRNLEAE